MSEISRRRFFLHSAHRTIGVSAGLAALEYGPWAADLAFAASEEKPLEVCLVSGSFEYKSDESLGAFQEHLERRFPIRCTRAFATSESELPGLEHLDTADCMLLFTRRLTIQGDALERVRRYCARGGAIVAVRTASHAFQNWLALDHDILGGDYKNHYGNASKPRIEIVASAKDHPVLAGVEPFVSSGSLYKNPSPAKDVTILLTGTIPDHTEPVAWVRTRAGAASPPSNRLGVTRHATHRVFYTSLGHPDDFRQAAFLRLLVNAIFWTTARKPETKGG